MAKRRRENDDSRYYLDWLDFALDDLEAARILKDVEVCRNAAAFHCQQCIEKALKAYILFRENQPVDGHNLTWLCKRAVKHDTSFSKWLDESAYLNRYYIETRYPADAPLELKNDQIQRAYHMAQQMYETICERLK